MKQFQRIFKYLRGYSGKIVLYFLCILLSIVFSMVSLAMLAPFLKLLFNKEDLVLNAPEAIRSASDVLNYLMYQISTLIVTKGELSALAFICIVIVSSILFKNVFLYLSYRILAPMRNGVLTRLRGDLYDKVLKLPVGFFTEQRKGDLISRMSNDANEVEWSVMMALEVLIKEPLNILLYLAGMIVISPKLSLFLLIFLPVMGFIIGRVSRSLKRQSTEAGEKNGMVLSILDETLGGIRVIKAFTAERLLGGKFHQMNAELNHIRNKINFRKDMASPLSEVLGVLVLSGVLWFGGQLVLGNNAGGLTSDGFITYIVFFTQIINPAKSLSSAYYNTKRGSAAIERIEEIINAPEVVEEIASPVHISSFEKSIEFKNVSFAYNDVTVLHNINLTLEKGKTVALVGSSGSGKSTLADLVPRFHDVTSGEILVDGVNIKNYSLNSLRQLMGIVTQEPILFNDTIANNIALSKPDALLAEIETAATIANAHSFISRKENGYHENIGDRGSKLSGGERQRVTIARAVLKNPPILILDEATSSLDTESERLVQDAINHLMQDRTSLVIAHRLSTVRHADEIIVLQKGVIVERGTHDQLVALDGFYRKLVELQEVR
ncbi:ATP-binding cassette, subfamily B, MsbA [Lacibacter cauensis]|uniref:ATP-binding cassette, subfamily B, MsbA n=1 Tax=Lacibacter cauensis TaxID=510947 RepID=A0A562SRG7_9BACT|nr:ABC transporter ATP-binding protein [Lacibacter cauensis]TWI83604.1 ATP-binding cassette, subfamily B, MsbA [Lacibacter cauensis]